ncbi:MAG: hypothetical protein DRI34_02295 [Deltaproteobacteria bacterium]|nr:MAG: hypothetical protein DRI34_02295 [Deltaproteobacteria bacterium]
MSQRLKQDIEVRCASCRRTFTTKQAGRIRCRWCHSEVELEVPAELLAEPGDPPGDADRQPTPEAVADATGPAPETAGGEEREALPDPVVTFPRSGSGPVPWESGTAGRVRKFFETVHQVMLRPADFFSRLGEDGPLLRAVIFGWLLAATAAALFAASALWELGRNPQAWLDTVGLQPGQEPQQLLDRAAVVLRLMLWTSPLLGLLNVLLTALAYHLGIWLLAPGPRSFRQTLRVTAYGCAPLVLVVVPVFGQLLGSFWSLWVQIVGLAVVHRLALARAAVAVLIPSTLALLLLGMLV